MSNRKDITKAILQWTWMNTVQVLGIVTGFVIVPLALLIRVQDKTKRIKFIYGSGAWYPVHLRKIFWAWDNLEDGFMGDHQGRYWNRDAPTNSKFLKQIFWGAFRNPFNNFKRYILGIDVREYVMTKLAGQDYVRDDFDSAGWQFLKATSLSNKQSRYAFYLVHRYGKSNRALVIQLGNKIKLSHNLVEEEDEYDYFKGFTMEINPFKDIS